MTEEPPATTRPAPDEVPPPPPAPAHPRDAEADPGPRLPRIPRLWWVTGVLGALTLIAAIVVSFLPSGYLVDAPGSAIPTDELVTLPDSVETYDHEGGFRLVTVSETARPVFGQALVGWLDPDADVFPRSEVTGDVPRAEEVRFQLVLMQNAKSSAIFQAMDVLGLPATMTGGGVFVSRIEPGSPAEGRLNIGDTITEIDGNPVHTVDDIARFMEDAEPGDEITLVVDRHGVSQNTEVDLTLGTNPSEGDDVAFIGIYMETRPHFQFPFDVGFDTGDIGGPSAGLALTLTLIDQLSAEGLTGGHQIAVTGTIGLDGSVGPVGGIRQKVAAVRDAGVHHFMVPAGNATEACEALGDPYPEDFDSHAGNDDGTVPAFPNCGDADADVLIIPVSSLDDSLAELAELPPAEGD